MERQEGGRHPLPGPCAPSNTDPGRTTMTASRPTGCSRRSRLALAIGAAVAFTTAGAALAQGAEGSTATDVRSAEHTSELPSLLRISSAVFSSKTTKHNHQLLHRTHPEYLAYI